MRLLHQDWVCLVNEEALHAAKSKARNSVGRNCAPSVQWRHIQVHGTPKALLLELSSVGAHGTPTLEPVTGTAQFGFSWEDLDDAAFICKIVAHEQFVVGTKVLQIMNTLKANKPALLRRLMPGVH